MYTTVEGRYKDGTIELSELPENVNEAKVLVTFLPAGREGQMMTAGMFRGGRLSTEEDFQEAEWHGEEGLPNGNEVRG